MRKSNFESVDEVDADKNVRIIFEDIKSTMGVALVNQVWRRFAVVPDVLQASWQTLKPCYQDGTILGNAWQLRLQLKPLALHPIASEKYDGLKSELKDTAVIDDVLRTYERGNAQNLIALCLLQNALGYLNNTGENQTVGDDKLTNKRLNASLSDEQNADALFKILPCLPRLQSLSEDMQALVARSSRVWVSPEYIGLQPSVFRHLSYWPGLLSLFTEQLEKLDSDCIDQSASQALDAAKASAKKLSVAYDGLMQLSAADRLWLHQELEIFIVVVLARGVVIVPTLRSLL